MACPGVVVGMPGMGYSGEGGELCGCGARWCAGAAPGLATELHVLHDSARGALGRARCMTAANGERGARVLLQWRSRASARAARELEGTGGQERRGR